MTKTKEPSPVRWTFVARYTLAQFGAFIGFLPLLSVLLPLKVSGMVPGSPEVVLSQAAICGALAAAVTNLLVGFLSDRTRSRFGRRKPWIVAGTGLTALSYAAVFQAATPVQLIGAVVLFQVTFNVLFSPLTAIFADRVPDRQKGLVSAFAALAHPAASLFAGAVIALQFSRGPGGYIVVVAALVLLLTPILLKPLGDPDVAPARVAARPGRPALLVAIADRDFRLAFLARLSVQTAISINALYLLFHIQRHSGLSVRLPGLGSEVALGLLIALSTVFSLVAGFGAGILSDRPGHRKGFVSIGALGIAGGAALLALWPAWPGPLVAQIVYGLGLGAFTTADQALSAEVLPDRANAGRDLGVMNIAVTLPQVLAPLSGILVLGLARWSLLVVFGIAAIMALCGAVLVQRISRRG